MRSGASGGGRSLNWMTVLLPPPVAHRRSRPDPRRAAVMVAVAVLSVVETLTVKQTAPPASIDRGVSFSRASFAIREHLFRVQ